MTLTAVSGVRVGHAEVEGGKSGCTVILGPFRGAVEVRGMATGTRELDLLSPHHLVGQIDALLFTGGSAFGLAAADGVVEWLAERGIGFETPVASVPLVPAAVIFDLSPEVPRPGPEEGRRAAEAASGAPVREGRVGAGAGATVGKLGGAGNSSLGGLGSLSRKWGRGTIGVLAVVNALGDVVGRDGRVLVGARGDDGDALNSDALAKEGVPAGKGVPAGSTTLVAVATDLPLSLVDLSRLAKMAAGAFPRAISPVHTPFDGDLVFSLSTGGSEADLPPEKLLSLGVLAREVTEEAIRRAVTVEAGGEDGFPEGAHPNP